MFKRIKKLFYTSICTYVPDDEMLRCMRDLSVNPYDELFVEKEIKTIYKHINQFTDKLKDINQLDLNKRITADLVNMELLAYNTLSNFLTNDGVLVNDTSELLPDFIDELLKLYIWYTENKNSNNSVIYRNRLWVRPYVINGLEIITEIRDVVNYQRSLKK